MLTSTQVGTSTVAGAYLDLDYTWDSFGNISETVEGGTTYTFSYDAQNRIAAAYGKSYSYWPTGRFQQFEGVTYTYGTGASGSPYHAVVSTSAGGAFGYDAAGNMTGRKLNSSAPQQTMGWTPANELRWVAVGGVLNESYRYDANGERILRSVEGGAVQYVYFPHYETSVQGGVTTVTKSYFFGGVRIAQKVGSGSVTYLHSDHLGSTVLTTPGNSSQQYHAYGATRSGSVPTEWQYTGQESDGTGLVYLHARYYDPASGQFLSPDTIVPDPNDVLSYNRYLYARGNPVRYVDPSGHADCAAGDSDCWNSQWQWNNRWYNAHGYHWGGAHWSVAGDPVFSDEGILDDTMAEAGISWDTVPEDDATWTFARKAKIASGIVRLGNFVSGGLARLNELVGGYATMVIATGGNLLCNRGRVPCTMPSWTGHSVVWPTAFIDATYGSPDYVSSTAVHEFAHLMDWQSGGSFSRWWKGNNAALGQYGQDCDGNPCIVRWERWAEAVQVAVYGPNVIANPLPVGQLEVATQADLVSGLLGGWIQP